MAERRIADIGPLLEDLKKELKDLEGSTEALTVEEAAEDEIEDLKKLPVIDPERMIPAWRDPDKDPPKVETEVLVLYRYNGYMGITTAHYEDGNVFSQDSEWNWEDLPDWGTYDEERDDYRIPEGWWEYRHFNPDDVYNNKIDCTVVGWMPPALLWFRPWCRFCARRQSLRALRLSAAYRCATRRPGRSTDNNGRL